MNRSHEVVGAVGIRKSTALNMHLLCSIAVVAKSLILKGFSLLAGLKLHAPIIAERRILNETKRIFL